jgi:hypothetical protein
MRTIGVLLLVMVSSCGGDDGGDPVSYSELCSLSGDAFCARANACGMLQGSIGECTVAFVGGCCSDGGYCADDSGVTDNDLDACVEDLDTLACSDVEELRLPRSCLVL